MVRSLHILLAALIVVVLFSGSDAQASNDAPAFAAAPTEAQDESNPYAGANGASPLDEVPVVPMIAGTVGLLGTLGLVAIRREWI